LCGYLESGFELCISMSVAGDTLSS